MAYTRENAQHLLDLARKKNLTSADTAQLSNHDLLALCEIKNVLNDERFTTLNSEQKELAAIYVANNPREEDIEKIIQIITNQK